MRVGIDVSWEAIGPRRGRCHRDGHVLHPEQLLLELTTRPSTSVARSVARSPSTTALVTVVTSSARTAPTPTTTAANEYGSSPGSRTFSANLSGAYNGITPSNSVSSKIPARPIGGPVVSPRPRWSGSATRPARSPGSTTTPPATPYDNVLVDRFVYGYSPNGFSGYDWGRASTSGGSAQSFADSVPIPNRHYTYRVCAKNSVDLSGWNQTNDIWTTPGTPSSCARSGTTGASDDHLDQQRQLRRVRDRDLACRERGLGRQRADQRRPYGRQLRAPLARGHGAAQLSSARVQHLGPASELLLLGHQQLILGLHQSHRAHRPTWTRPAARSSTRPMWSC